MKATIFYITATLTMILLTSSFSIPWIIMGTMDLLLILWCKNNITIRELVKLCGYDIWYKFLRQ